jgi:hypothetical protein
LSLRRFLSVCAALFGLLEDVVFGERQGVYVKGRVLCGLCWFVSVFRGGAEVFEVFEDGVKYQPFKMLGSFITRAAM